MARDFPAIGEQPWAPKLLAALTSMDGELEGRLSPAELSATFVTGVGAANARPRGNRTVLMGDSITSYNGGLSTSTPAQSAGYANFDSKGMWRWANIILGQRLDIIGNSGIGGQETSQIRARFQTDVLDLNPDIVSLLAGTNDDGPEDDTWDNLRWMYEAALAASIFVVAFTIPPQTTGALATYRQGVNDEIREYVRAHPGMALVDLAAAWQDNSQPGFVARTDYLHDNTHPNTRGAQVGGRAIAEVLQGVLPDPVEEAPSASAPHNMLTDGRFAGSGTTLPTGWGVSTGAATFSYVPGPGGIGQRLAVNVPAGGTVTIGQNVNKGVLLREGDAYDFTVTVEPYDLEPFGLSSQRINVFTQEYNGSSFSERKDAVYIDGGASYGSARYPAASGRFRTQRHAFTAGKTLLQVVVTLLGGGTYLLSNAVARNLTMLEAGVESPEEVPHTSLISNGSFEADAAGWASNAGATFVRTTSERRTGVAGGQITHAADVNSDARYDRVPVNPLIGLNYCLWVKAPSGHAGVLRFFWFTTTAGGYISTTNLSFTGSGGWQKLIATIPDATIPDTAGAVQFTVSRGDATGTPVVYVDEVDLWQV